MKAREIIRRPLLTEKTTLMQERENTVCFEVDRRANKIQVRHAVEELFDVEVASVHIVNRKGKNKLNGGLFEIRDRFLERSQSNVRMSTRTSQGDDQA